MSVPPEAVDLDEDRAFRESLQRDREALLDQIRLGDEARQFKGSLLGQAFQDLCLRVLENAHQHLGDYTTVDLATIQYWRARADSAHDPLRWLVELINLGTNADQALRDQLAAQTTEEHERNRWQTPS